MSVQAPCLANCVKTTQPKLCFCQGKISKGTWKPGTVRVFTGAVWIVSKMGYKGIMMTYLEFIYITLMFYS